MNNITETITHYTATECIELCKQGAILVDVREEYDIAGKQFGIAGIIILHYSELKNNYKSLPKDKLLILADCVGLRSKEAVIFLQQNGFSNVANLAGGILDWERQGHKTIRNKDEMMSGVCACKIKSKNRKINYK